MVAPDRVPVLDAFDVVPHPVTVDDRAAGGLGDRQHAAVNMVGNACDQVFRRHAEVLRPVLPHQLMIGSDSSGGDYDGLSVQLERAHDIPRALAPARGVARRENVATNAIDCLSRSRHLVDAMAEPEGHMSLFCGLAYAIDEWRDDAGARAPRDVKPRHGVAAPDRVVPAALRPADHRKKPHAALVQPRPFLAGGKPNVGLGPSARPMIFLSVEAGRAHPVGEGELVGIMNAHPTLFRRVDEKDAAERPERLTAEGLLRLLIENDDAL